MTTDDVRGMSNEQVVDQLVEVCMLRHGSGAFIEKNYLRAELLRRLTAAEAPDPERVIVSRDDLALINAFAVRYDDDMDERELEAFWSIKAALAPASDRSDGGSR